MGQLTQYGSFDIDAAEEEEAKTEAERESEFFQFKEGRNVVRILPPIPPNRSPFQVTHQHKVDVPGQQYPLRVMCRRLMAKEDCPLCKESSRLRRSGNAQDREAGFRLKATRRVYANVIDRRDPDKGVRVMAFGKKIHDPLISIRKDRDEGGDYTDPTGGGFDVIIKRTGTKQNDTEYTVSRSVKTRPLSPDTDQANEWIEDQYDLGSYAVLPTRDQLAALMEGDLDGFRNDSGGGSGRSVGGGGRGGRAALPPGEKSRTAEDDVIDADYAETSNDPFDAFDDGLDADLNDEDIPF